MAKTPNFVIVGDFNLPEIDWETEYAPNGSTSQKMLAWLHSHALTQHIRHPARFRSGHVPSILDLVITRYDSDVSECVLQDPLGKSDYCVLCIVLPTDHKKSVTKVRNYGRVQVDQLKAEAEVLQWVPKCWAQTIVERWGLIKSGLLKLTEKFAP